VLQAIFVKFLDALGIILMEVDILKGLSRLTTCRAEVKVKGGSSDESDEGAARGLNLGAWGRTE
jgi:hypothetical protein